MDHFSSHGQQDSDQPEDDTGGLGTGSGESYQCVFCKRGFTNAQALGGHMNIHRRDRARMTITTTGTSTTNKQQQQQQHHHHHNQIPLISSHPKEIRGFLRPGASSHSSRPGYCHTYFPPPPSTSNYAPRHHHHQRPQQQQHQQPALSLFDQEDRYTSLELRIGNQTTTYIDHEVKRQEEEEEEEEIDLELRLGHDN